MSLFKAREWWHAHCGHDEEFDGGCLCVANIDNDPSGAVKLITGSFQGNLRIYLPRDRDYKADDLLLEQELEQAILQVAAGRFSVTGGVQLAVLHPRKLVVFNVLAQGTSYLQLNKLYEHYLEHTAANMTCGSFGGVQGADYIAVQSYDGQLSFFECEAPAFGRYLPNFLVPGPIAYNEQSDSFLTATAAMELECYKYKVLAAASGEKATGKDTSGSHAQKKLQADWKVILGEAAVDIQVGRFSQGLQTYQSDIVVLGEHNIFVVNNNGQIIFQKRLEYHPACCTTYAVPGAKVVGGAENLLVATHTHALQVYRGTALQWSAKCDVQVVGLAVADIGAFKGAIIGLSDSGDLLVMYLGTDPLLNPVGFAEGKDLDYEAMAREHRSLATVIRDHGSLNPRFEPTEKLMMRTQVPLKLDSARHHDIDDLSSGMRLGQKQLTVRLYLAHTGGYIRDGLTLTIQTPEPLVVESEIIKVPSVSTNPSDPTLVNITFLAAPGLPPHSAASIIATYATQGGEPRAQRLDLQLPMCLFCAVIPPVKNADFKLTITTNRPAPPLNQIFEDMVAQAAPGTSQALMASLGSSGGAQGANVLSFQYHGAVADVTILVSKNGGRYRVQSDAFEGLWLVIQELGTRLAAYYLDAEAGLPMPGEGPYTMSYDEAIPIEDFFEVVEQHFSARQHVEDLKQQLEDRAVQFRNVEKRLLMRFKDKNPAPLNQLDVLMDETYTSLMDLGTAMDHAQNNLRTAQRKLGGAVQLLLLLVKLRFQLADEDFEVMKAALPPKVTDGPEAGWEETTEAAMTHLLRTCLAKNAKETAVQVGPLTTAKDTSRLRKHLSLVLERMSRGMRLTAPTPAANGNGVLDGPSEVQPPPSMQESVSARANAGGHAPYHANASMPAALHPTNSFHAPNDFNGNASLPLPPSQFDGNKSMGNGSTYNMNASLNAPSSYNGGASLNANSSFSANVQPTNSFSSNTGAMNGGTSFTSNAASMSGGQNFYGNAPSMNGSMQGGHGSQYGNGGSFNGNGSMNGGPNARYNDDDDDRRDTGDEDDGEINDRYHR